MKDLCIVYCIISDFSTGEADTSDTGGPEPSGDHQGQGGMSDRQEGSGPVAYPGIRQNIGRQRKRRRLKAKIIDCKRTAGFSGKKITDTIKFDVMMMEPLMLLWRRRRSNRNYNICQWILTYLLMYVSVS